MLAIAKEFRFSASHLLKGLPPGHPCANLHGHNYVLCLELVTPRSALTEVGFVRDFRDLDEVKKWVDATLDHTMLLHRDDPVLPMLRQIGERVHVLDVNLTAENIAKLIFDYAQSQGFPVVEVRLWETESCFATYTGPGG